MEEPTKSDIDAIFKRLKSLSANKICFDCEAKNPTWASVTYGVFLCIDCSARHRGLGVHLSFIRSTNLDTSWGWLQLRAMQVGGNANAEAFFQQHGCSTKDTQQKYNSRAAQLYREKLHQLATKALKQHGTKLFLDEGHKHDHSSTSNEKKDEDFFHEHSQTTTRSTVEDFGTNLTKSTERKDDDQGEGPSVDPNLLNSDAAAKNLDPKKTSIGQRRAAPAKKKGFGAQKVTTDFKEIERNAQEQEKMREQQVQIDAKTREENEKQLEKQMAGMKFAYQDLNKQRDVQEAKLKQSNPQKAEQVERLGMGFANRGGGISHSAMTDMQTIEQEGVTNTRNVSLASKSRDFFDEFPPSRSSKFVDDDLFKPKSSTADWEVIDRKSPTNEIVPSAKATTNDGDALKRFSNAKAISSDQFFNKESDNDRNNAASRFQGSTSISSEDYFGDSNRKQSKSTAANYQGPDLATMKADFKEGVSKAAGRLSSLANSVMSSIQDRY